MAGINLRLDYSGIAESELHGRKEEALAVLAELRQDKEEYTGWVNCPRDVSEDLLEELEKTADEVCEKCDKLIVIGIGGSYLGTAAIIDALGGSAEGRPKLVFAGNNLSGTYHARFRHIIQNEDVCLCVVSKSGGTMETHLAFEILKSWMYEKYGHEETATRIVAITDAHNGMLREEADREGYKSFVIPSNIGGRYSAFTPAIMFPLAVAGVDIRALVKGAAEIAADDLFWQEQGTDYALARLCLIDAGKEIEALEFYEPALRLVGEWCKQLFGESEGKDGKGLFPTSLYFSADLHSLGQFLQEGNQIFFETVVNIASPSEDIALDASMGDSLDGRTLNEINQTAIKGVVQAHRKADIPIIVIEIEDNKEYCIGQLLYFMMMTAAITGKLMGVDPFNQPGVEAYKAEIRTLLGQ